MTTIFSVQNETGTVAQLTIMPSPSPAQDVSVGDTGLYTGFPDDGTASFATPAFASLPFTVVQVLDDEHFSVSTINASMADWPAFGQITWTTGANVEETTTVVEIDGANAYITVAEYIKYHSSRGNALPVGKTEQDIQAAIVQSTDYLDQKYRFNGVKLLQTVGNAIMDANATFIESWLTPYALQGVSYLTPSTTTQSTEWPRQGVVDYNGDTVNGIPKAVKAACAELAIRVLNGTALQPDYDPGIVSAGGVVSSITKKVGPLETVTAYDTKFGLGFFASFPIVDRMLSKAGLLSSGGGRTVIR
jgi:hypothetical protein